MSIEKQRYNNPDPIGVAHFTFVAHHVYCYLRRLFPRQPAADLRASVGELAPLALGSPPFTDFFFAKILFKQAGGELREGTAAFKKAAPKIFRETTFLTI